VTKGAAAAVVAAAQEAASSMKADLKETTLTGVAQAAAKTVSEAARTAAARFDGTPAAAAATTVRDAADRTIQAAADDAVMAAPAVAQATAKQVAKAPSFFRDLLRDDLGRADIGDFQMLTVTLLAGLTYGIQLVAYLSALPLAHAVKMPDVDSTILATFGLGQGAYLTKKYLGGPEK